MESKRKLELGLIMLVFMNGKLTVLPKKKRKQNKNQKKLKKFKQLELVIQFNILQFIMMENMITINLMPQDQD